MRWIVATCDWTTAAEVAIEGASPPIHRIDFLRHADDLVLELDTERPIRSLWPRQREAVDKVVKGLHHNDRGRLTMACGTGKTFTSLRIAEQVVPDGGNIVFLAPSIALVSQARREWLRHTSRPLECAVVCSDSSAGGRGEQADVRLSELECAVSSDPAELADLLSVESRNDVTRVVFCTYQSLKHLTAAQDQLGAPTFDLALCDEAHRTTGVDRGASGGLTTGFQAVHRDESLRADKRLYMTATPRIYSHRSRSSLASRGIETVDMSDLNVYGPELELLSFKEAVNDGLLSDYRVIVLGVHENAIPSGMRNRLVSLGERLSEEKTKPLIITEDEMMRLLGTSLAVNGLAEGDDLDRPGRLHRTIAFANSILRSKFFAEGLRQPELKSLITRRTRHSDPGATESLRIDVQHLDGTDSALKRNKALRELGQAGEEDIARVLCNVRLFGEGVDVPSLDAIVFMEPRDSQIDIVQAVGRVMRRSEGKRLGYIVVPVPIAPGSDLATALSEGNSGYEALGQVLRALQSHDGRLAENPLHYVQAHEIQRTPAEEPEQPDTTSSQLVLDLREAGQGIYAHVVASSGLGTPGLLVADDIALAVRAAARLFEEGELAGPLADAMGLATPENDRDVCTIAALLVQNACLLHRRLCDVPRMNWLSDLATVSGDESPAVALRRDWEKILELDYKPVFEPALAVLDALPPRRFAYHALCRLAECANRTAASLSDMGYDHAGPLYHRILPNAEATGAFYTNNLSALLLARLAIDSEFSDWADEGQVRDLRIMDPACGTGTLLMAALHVLKSRCKEAHGLASEEQAELHQALVENVLCGLDINRHATQLAACNLTLGAPTVDYQQINLFTLRHGPQPDGTMQAGSLELLSTAASADSLHSLVRPLRTQQGIGAVQVNDTELDFALQDLDLVIMNPPFTNNTKRHRQYTDEQVQQMQQHELRIRDHIAMSDPAAGDVIDSNSIRTFFTPLADQMLNSERGVLAEVLPVTATTGAAGKSERRFLASRFHIERIITSHDPKRINFSENTTIHECLVIARRSDSSQDTEFFSLRKMPATPEEALSAADAIDTGKAPEWGSRTLWPADRIASGDWSPVQWFNGHLAEAAYELSTSPNLEPMGRNHEIGPAGQRIRDAFEQCQLGDQEAVPIFWSVSSKIHNTMRSSPEAYGLPKMGKQALANKYWHRRSCLLVAQKYNTMSGRLTAIWSPSPSIGSGWTPVAVSDKIDGMALAAWWNSTPVRLLLLNLRSKTLTYPNWSLDQLRGVGIPKSDSPARATLAQAWEEASDMVMLPLSQAVDCPVRPIIDRAAALALGVDEQLIGDWREMLAREPTISNRVAD